MKRIFSPGADSLPTATALLVLRCWLGLTMLFNHGWLKLQDFNSMKGGFPDPLGVGHTASLTLSLGAEVFASALLALGLLTRFAALGLAFNMMVAFVAVHHGMLKGEKSGELAFIYLAGFVALILAGPGRFSVDQKVFGRR